MDDPFDLSPPPPSDRPSDLARHFMECGALNANLSLAPGKRLVITDDLLNGTVGDLAAMSMAAIVARDGQVAHAAIIPLSVAASRASSRDRARYERLFQLIEETAFDRSVRDSAEALIAARFREAEIRDLARSLGGTVNAARQRYRAFLDTIRQLVARQISQPAFLDEFVDFTRMVAGKLDFGIYAMCIERLFASDNIPLTVKTMLLKEVLAYPPLIRKELVTSLLSSATAPAELIRYARRELGRIMTRDQIKEIFLFTTLKLAWQARTPVGGQASGLHN